MKAALILAVAGLAASQNLSGEPACATSCLSSAISKAGCQLNDQACQCGPTQSAIAGFAGPCLLSACSNADLVVAISAGSKLCAEFSSGIAFTTTTSSGTGSMVITSTITSTSSSSSSSGSSEESTTTSSGGSAATTSTGTVTTSSSQSNSRDSGSATTTKATTTGASSISHNLAAAATPAFVGALAAVMGVVAAL